MSKSAWGKWVEWLLGVGGEVGRLVGWLVVVIDPLSLIFRSVENRTRAYLQLLNVR